VVNRLVVMAFKVRADSTLYDLKVVRSGGDSYSTEALRLMREGPKWTPVIRNGEVVEEEVKITIVFK
jgi:protein TonB